MNQELLPPALPEGGWPLAPLSNLSPLWHPIRRQNNAKQRHPHGGEDNVSHAHYLLVPRILMTTFQKPHCKDLAQSSCVYLPATRYSLSLSLSLSLSPPHDWWYTRIPTYLPTLSSTRLVIIFSTSSETQKMFSVSQLTELGASNIPSDPI